MPKKSRTAAEKRHLSAVVALGCIVCRLRYGAQTPAVPHHLRGHPWSGAGQRASDYDVIPLCPAHHQTGGYGVAYHAGAEEWERRYGTQGEFLDLTLQLLRGAL